MNLFDLIIVLIAGTASSWLLTRLFLAWVLSRALLDIPNARSSHSRPTPTGGGVVFVLLFLGGIAALALLYQISLDEFLALSGAGFLVAAVGWRDDYRPVRALWRICVHFLAAGWALYWLGGVPSLLVADYPLQLGWVGYPLAAFGLVWMLNLFNFMDGIDGLAASEAVFVMLAASALGLITGHTSGVVMELAPLIILAAGCSGFLLWNWPPASIFMGDVGSGFLGFVIGLLALITVRKELIPLCSWIILCSVFLVDATFTLLRRIVRGERFYQAHRSHAYQHATQVYNGHGPVTIGICLVNAGWLFPLALIVMLWPRLGPVLVLVAMLPLLILAFRFGAGMAASAEVFEQPE